MAPGLRLNKKRRRIVLKLSGILHAEPLAFHHAAEFAARVERRRFDLFSELLCRRVVRYPLVEFGAEKKSPYEGAP